MKEGNHTLREIAQELSAGIDAIRASAAHKEFPLDTFKQFAEFIPATIWIADSGGTIVHYNRHFYNFAGRHGVSCWDLMHPADRHGVEMAWNRCVEEGTPYEGSVRLRDAAGVFCWHAELAMPIKDCKRRITHWVGISIDLQGVLERKSAA